MGIIKSKYVFIHPEIDGQGHGTILLTQSPYFTGRVIKFESADEYSKFLTKYRCYPIAKVKGYRIAIQYAGAMDGLINDLNDSEFEKAQEVLDEMAEYYLKERVSKKYNFKRYAL